MPRVTILALATSFLAAVSGLTFPRTFPRQLRPPIAAPAVPSGGSGDDPCLLDLEGVACDPLDAFPPPECTESPELDTWVRADDESVYTHTRVTAHPPASMPLLDFGCAAIGHRHIVASDEWD